MNCIIGISEILFLPIQYTQSDFFTESEMFELELWLDFSSYVKSENDAYLKLEEKGLLTSRAFITFRARFGSL